MARSRWKTEKKCQFVKFSDLAAICKNSTHRCSTKPATSPNRLLSMLKAFGRDESTEGIKRIEEFAEYSGFFLFHKIFIVAF